MRGKVLEVEGAAHAKALSRRPWLPLCPPRDVLGWWGWTAVPARGQECVQGPFKRTFSNTAVGIPHVATSSLANVPLKPCFTDWVWACVFFLRRNSWEARRPWTFGETPEATGPASPGFPHPRLPWAWAQGYPGGLARCHARQGDGPAPAGLRRWPLRQGSPSRQSSSVCLPHSWEPSSTWPG